ncbi:MAG: PfkB family carbohydrate kinase [Paraglaciecola sp.]|uniref:PfkB family carbohydrate kinase n=1 Tax=Paraglaciecola sp. TaxID=1920173 RepID=UPI003297BD31
MQLKAAVFGEALFDLIEQPDHTLTAHIGGSPFNVARSFVKQRISTVYVSPISTDRYGDRIYDYAKSEGMILPDQNRSKKLTSLAVVSLDASGQPDYSLYRSNVADLDVSAAKLIATLPNDIQLFHSGSLTLVPSMLTVLGPCFEYLKSKNVLISVDVNMRKGVELDNDKYIAAVKELLKFADIVKVSDEDLNLLGIDLPPIEGARQILSMLDNGLVVLTEGAEGATLLGNDFTVSQPVFQPAKFEDAVGAGDTFFSAFLSKLLSTTNEDSFEHIVSNKAKLEAALIYGLMAATLNVEQCGCQPPTKQEVETALALKTRG